MIGGSRVEIRASDLHRIMAFYRQMFSWEFIKDREIENSWLLLAPYNNGQLKVIRLREKGLFPQQEAKGHIFLRCLCRLLISSVMT